jgi:hypothetical protein
MKGGRAGWQVRLGHGGAAWLSLSPGVWLQDTRGIDGGSRPGKAGCLCLFHHSVGEECLISASWLPAVPSTGARLRESKSVGGACTGAGSAARGCATAAWPLGPAEGATPRGCRAEGAPLVGAVPG